MIFIPLPLVVALLLLMLLAVLLRTRRFGQGNPAFLILIGLCALQSIMVGLRWGYGIETLRYVLPILAACMPPLVLASFRSLIHPRAGEPWAIWWHALSPIAVTTMLLVVPYMIDMTLIALFVGYASALLLLGRTGPDALDEARLEGAVAAHRALVIAAMSLCVSACLDLVVQLDFQWTKGQNAALIVSNGNLLGLLLIGLTALAAARAQASPEPTEEVGPGSSAEEDQKLLERVGCLLSEQKLFLDENLTLARLARRVGVPARQISRAVNRMTGKNVSQYINDYRIAEACRLLRQPHVSVTSAMLESGFQTKSNFNREFRRVTSLSPATWRDSNQLT